MLDMECLSIEEQDAIKELKNRMKNKLTSPVLNEDSSLFYRFLKARDFDVDKAEKMLLKHIEWRKVYQVDTILETFKPKEVFLKITEPCLVGFDKEGNIVRYAATGRVSNTEVMKCFTIHDYMKHWIWFFAKSVSSIMQQAKITGKMPSLCIILDLDGLEFSNATSKISADIFLRLIQLMQDNSPERLKHVYVINAPYFYVFVYTIAKTVMSSAMIKKFTFLVTVIIDRLKDRTFLNSNSFREKYIIIREKTEKLTSFYGWKEKLLEAIDEDVLPAFLGGKRTDPDGDPYCRSIINLPGKIPKKYFLSEEERYFKDPTEVTTFVISPLRKKEIFVHVKESGSLIQWKFMVLNKSIIFGLYFQESQKVIKEILPMYEYDTSDGKEENSYKCLSKGKYILIFENPSRFSTKEIQYIISVDKAEI